jgi:Flp pilus assembly pilin Flp
MKSRLQSFVEDERGQDLAEYALLMVFGLVAVIGLAPGFHDSIATVTTVSNAQLDAARNAAH